MKINEIQFGTAGGVLFASTIIQLSAGDIIKTTICAAIGAAVSYFTTLLLKRFLKN